MYSNIMIAEKECNHVSGKIIHINQFNTVKSVQTV